MYSHSQCNLFGSFRVLINMVFFLLVCLQYNLPTAIGSFDPFMDTDLFSINWEGPLNLNDEEVKILGDRHVTITTNNHEKYECILPESKKSAKDSADLYSGPTADELMQPLFDQTQCSYRIESYWTYELCHGRHLKQYHETKEQGTNSKVQEYYLGFGNHRKPKEGDSKDKPVDEKTEMEEVLPVKVLEDEQLPYYEVIMTDGTKCDLINQPRKTHVFYVCHAEGRGEVYEFKESSTCVYEVLVLTSRLCNHPKFRPRKPAVSEVRCHAVVGSPLKPSELINVERETQVLQRAGQDYIIHQSQPQPPSYGSEDASQRKTSLPPKIIRKPSDAADAQPLPEDKLGTLTDKQTLRDFFNGHSCLQGGTGWWKQEICFGKYVRQYHAEQGKETASILLGKWNKEKHLAWLITNPLKRPKDPSKIKFVSQFYTGGDICDLTGRVRVCEVRLKCFANTRKPHALMLSLSEPKTCEYILTVESNLFCSVLKDVDEDGLFSKLDL